jgi:putative transposase
MSPACRLPICAASMASATPASTNGRPRARCSVLGAHASIAQECRFGYRRPHVLLKREGNLVNHKKLFRLYREEKLAVRRRGSRKRAIGTRTPMMVPMAPNDRWSLDFVSDQLTDGRRFRILTVVDDCTRECLTLVADTSLSGTRVARELDLLTTERGRPRMKPFDQHPQIAAVDIVDWEVGPSCWL